MLAKLWALISLKRILILERILIVAGYAVLAVAFSMYMKMLDTSPPKAALIPTLQYLTAADLNAINAKLVFMTNEIDRLRKGQVAIGEDFVGRLEKIEAWQAKASPVTTGSIKQKR